MEMPQKNLPNKGPQEMSVDPMLFSGPIPGEGLTSDPTNPKPWERPPEFTELEKAQEYIFTNLMENNEDFIGLIGQGIPVDHIATTVVMGGFMQGKWTPDLMMLLIEPVIYMLLFLAEQTGIDYVISEDEEEEYLEPEAERKVRSQLDKYRKQVGKKVKENTESSDIQSLLPPSLLESGEM